MTEPKLMTPLFSLKQRTPEENSNLLQDLSTDKRFFRMCHLLPQSEIANVVQHIPEAASQSALQLAASLIFNRLTNPICNFCNDKSDVGKLLACSQCMMTFYCSETCQKQDWNNTKRQSHKMWCCNQQTKPDDGPLQSVFLKLKN